MTELCDLDGAKLVIREDDREAVIRERLDAYERQTQPVLEYFRGQRAGGWSKWMRAAIRRRRCCKKICRAIREERSGCMIVRKTAAELEKMRRSGLLVWKILQKLGEMAVEGRQHAWIWKSRRRR